MQPTTFLTFHIAIEISDIAANLTRELYIDQTKIYYKRIA